MTDSLPVWRNGLRSAIPRLLITGGSGFIGTNAVQFAWEAGIETRNVDVRPPKSPGHMTLWKHCDLLDAHSLRRAISEFQPSHVLHLAARTDLQETRNLEGYAANMQGLGNLMDALDGSNCGRAIFTSSMLVCRNGYQPHHEEEYCPDTLYGESKMRGEAIVRGRHPNYFWSIVRPTSIWGPWFEAPYRQFFRTVARRLYRHPGLRPIEKALGFVGNTVWQLYRLLTAPPAAVKGRTFYLSDYRRLTTWDWASLIAREYGTAPIRPMPLPLLRTVGFGGDVARFLGMKHPPLTSFRLRNMLTASRFDLSGTENISGPLPFTTEEGVKQTVSWLASEGAQ
jgi:nucleoside-diphosphate-sugar epimerase